MSFSPASTKTARATSRTTPSHRAGPNPTKVRITGISRLFVRALLLKLASQAACSGSPPPEAVSLNQAAPQSFSR